MKTGLITSDTYQNHNTGEGHPEKIDRVTAVIKNFNIDRSNLSTTEKNYKLFLLNLGSLS